MNSFVMEMTSLISNDLMPEVRKKADLALSIYSLEQVGLKAIRVKDYLYLNLEAALR